MVIDRFPLANFSATSFSRFVSLLISDVFKARLLSQSLSK